MRFAALVLCARGVGVAPRMPLLVGAAWDASSSALLRVDAIAHRIAPCVDGSVVEVYGAIVGLPKVSARQIQFDVEPDARSSRGPRARDRCRDGCGCRGSTAPRSFPARSGSCESSCAACAAIRIPAVSTTKHGVWPTASTAAAASVMRERRAAPTGWSWDRLRLVLRERFAALPLEHAGILLALLTGDGGLMDEADWSLFRATGTVHLMVISGLHLTIVAAIGVSRWAAQLARLSPGRARTQRLDVAAACAGGVFVTLYACLAGWGVPVLRSWLATLSSLLLLPMGRRMSLPMHVPVGCAIVLTSDPLAPLQAGFWLSFGAVAVLLAYFAPRFEPGFRDAHTGDGANRTRLLRWCRCCVGDDRQRCMGGPRREPGRGAVGQRRGRAARSARWRWSLRSRRTSTSGSFALVDAIVGFVVDVPARAGALRLDGWRVGAQRIVRWWSAPSRVV